MKAKPKQNRNTHKGVSVVELAVCLPMLVLLTMGAVETTSMIYFKQSLKVTAYQGARVALISGSQNSNVVAQCDLIIADRNVSNATVDISHDVASAPAGTIIAVTVSAPCRNNGLFSATFFQNSAMSATVEMMKEN